jgi:hypothetical protein
VAQHRVADAPRGVVEIDVDALGTGGGERRVFTGPPAMPTVRQLLILAIWPTAAPTAPAAVDTTTVSPGFGAPMSRSPK